MAPTCRTVWRAPLPADRRHTPISSPRAGGVRLPSPSTHNRPSRLRPHLGVVLPERRPGSLLLQPASIVESDTVLADRASFWLTPKSNCDSLARHESPPPEGRGGEHAWKDHCGCGWRHSVGSGPCTRRARSGSASRRSPSGGDWTLGPVTDALPDVDNGNFKDSNGDGLACHKVNEGQSGKHNFESWTWKDNTN